MHVMFLFGCCVWFWLVYMFILLAGHIGQPASDSISYMAAYGFISYCENVRHMLSLGEKMSNFYIPAEPCPPRQSMAGSGYLSLIYWTQTGSLLFFSWVTLSAVLLLPPRHFIQILRTFHHMGISCCKSYDCFMEGGLMKWSTTIRSLVSVFSILFWNHKLVVTFKSNSRICLFTLFWVFIAAVLYL